MYPNDSAVIRHADTISHDRATMAAPRVPDGLADQLEGLGAQLGAQAEAIDQLRTALGGILAPEGPTAGLDTHPEPERCPVVAEVVRLRRQLDAQTNELFVLIGRIQL